MPKSGNTMEVTFLAQRIEAAISDFTDDAHFTADDINQKTGINKHKIVCFLVVKAQQGVLERVNRGYYKKVLGAVLAKQTAHGFAAESIWQVLLDSNRALTHDEINRIVKEKTGQDFYGDIGCCLLHWSRRLALDKFGGQKPYSYRIKAGWGKNRPVNTPKFRTSKRQEALMAEAD